MQSRNLVALSLIITLAASAGVGAAEDGAVAPKLEEIEPPAPASPPPGDDDVKPLPASVTICYDPSAQRCWTESGATECTADATPGAKVFRHVASNADPGTALTDCWSALRR